MAEDPQSLPARPSLRHLKEQARDLLRAGRAPTLTAAQFAIARHYGFASWPTLKAHVDGLHVSGRFAEALDAGDLELAQDLARRTPTLLHARLFDGEAPLMRLARRDDDPARTQARLRMAEWLIGAGAVAGLEDGGALSKAAYHDDVAMAELLLQHGADAQARDPMICACEVISPRVIRCLLDHGAPAIPEAARMLLQTYMRRLEGKHAGLEALAAAGCVLPDTAAMAVHRGRIDLLERIISDDPVCLERPLSEQDIYPPALRCTPGNGLHASPLAGGTLLHLAIEYDELAIARWLLERGAEVNARANARRDGHTPLFHAVVTQGRKAAEGAQLLLDHGADANARATITKQLRYMGDAELERERTYNDATPIGYARRWAVPRWVNEAAIAVVVAAGGRDEISEVSVL